MKNKRSYKTSLKVIVLILALCFLLANCGVKAPPVPPDYDPPAAIKDLGYTIETDGSVVLSWSLSGKERDRGTRVKGAKVYRSKDSLENPACEDCPRTFSVAKDIPLDQKNLVYREPLQKGFRYYYKIILYDESSQESADSNVVSFEY